MDRRDMPPGVGVPPHVPGLGKDTRPGARSVPRAPGPTGAPGYPGGGGGGGAGLSGLSLPPPNSVKPPGGHDFQVFSTVTAGPAVTPVAFTGARSTFLIPTANVGVIRSVVFLVNGLLTTSNVLFSVLFNGGGVEGWNGIPVLPRLASSVSSSYGPEETFIEVPENTTVSLSVTVTDGVAYQVSALLHGWFYPTELANAFIDAYQL